MIKTENSKQCAFCKHYSEPFNEFGHLLHARCTKFNRFTNYDSTCNSFEKDSADLFFTDLNDDD